MSTPAHGIELPRFRPSSPEPFSTAAFVRDVERRAADLRARTTPRPAGGGMRAAPAPASTDDDPEFESGERRIRRGDDDDTLDCSESVNQCVLARANGSG